VVERREYPSNSRVVQGQAAKRSEIVTVMESHRYYKQVIANKKSNSHCYYR